MPLDTPFRLGPFIVDAHGRLEPSDPGRFPSFHVTWRGCPVHARLDAGTAAEAQPARLMLRATVGRVPSTAGGDATHNRARRKTALGALHGLQGRDGDTARLRLLPDHRVVVEATRPVQLPASAGDLLTQTTCFLLDLGPYLDVLAEAGVPVDPVGGVSPGGGGIAKT